MKFSLLLSPLALVAFAGCATTALAETPITKLQVQNELQIPGATLTAGTYSVSVEDQLSDRAIVRISGPNDAHYLLLTVPNANLPKGQRADGLVYFSGTNNNKQILRGWNCADCSTGLEFVYPKLEAVAITDKTTQPVAAVDPTYDKLPATLSPDDMKVVTLWLLSPETITADHKGEGVKAAKYNTVSQVRSTTETASASIGRKHLPKTGTNTLSLGLYGMLLLAAAAAVRQLRMRGAARI